MIDQVAKLLPSDNLYKFLTFFGLVMFAGSFYGSWYFRDRWHGQVTEQLRIGTASIIESENLLNAMHSPDEAKEVVEGSRRPATGAIKGLLDKPPAKADRAQVTSGEPRYAKEMNALSKVQDYLVSISAKYTPDGFRKYIGQQSTRDALKSQHNWSDKQYDEYFSGFTDAMIVEALGPIHERAERMLAMLPQIITAKDELAYREANWRDYENLNWWIIRASLCFMIVGACVWWYKVQRLQDRALRLGLAAEKKNEGDDRKAE
jgi:hypothetical protein